MVIGLEAGQQPARVDGADRSCGHSSTIDIAFSASTIRHRGEGVRRPSARQAAWQREHRNRSSKRALRRRAWPRASAVASARLEAISAFADDLRQIGQVAFGLNQNRVENDILHRKRMGGSGSLIVIPWLRSKFASRHTVIVRPRGSFARSGDIEVGASIERNFLLLEFELGQRLIPSDRVVIPAPRVPDLNKVVSPVPFSVEIPVPLDQLGNMPAPNAWADFTSAARGPQSAPPSHGLVVEWFPKLPDCLGL